MNIFVLDYEHDRNAEYHVDRHVTKMQLEGAQMLSTNIWVDQILGYVPRMLTSDELQELKKAVALNDTYVESDDAVENALQALYKINHFNHPCTVWARESLENFSWLICYVDSLHYEGALRGYNRHKSYDAMLKFPDPVHIKDLGLTKFAQAMPDQYKKQDAKMAYRTYYLREKQHIASWKHRNPPYWWNP